MAGSLRGIRVLILGSGVTLTGAMRALGGDGADVMAQPDVQDFARRSRWYRAAPAGLAGLTPGRLATALPELPSGTVLVPCSDSWVRAVASLPSELRERYPSCLAPVPALDTLVDKARFGATLARLGLPHPLTRPVAGTTDLDPVSDAVLEHSFLKPTDSQSFFARYQVKAFQLSGRADAEQRLRTCVADCLGLVLQEYIPGPPTHHYFVDGFVDRAGAMRAVFVRQRLRMYPPDFGNSTLMVSVPRTDAGDAPETLARLFEDLHYRGIFSAEFKRDARDGRFKLLEVNARPWWYVEFAARCGVNVCAMAVHDALGQPVANVERYVVGRHCVYPYYDLSAVQAESAAGRLSLLSGISSWLGAIQPVFRWADPLPAMGEVAAMIWRRVLG
jgi:predicted ATP-grasp superfamily ATP-dependent carboligase